MGNYDFGFLGLKGFLLITCFFFLVIRLEDIYCTRAYCRLCIYYYNCYCFKFSFQIMIDDVWHFGSTCFNAFESEIAFSWSKVSTYIICLFANM